MLYIQHLWLDKKMWTPIIIVVHIICVGLVKKQTLWLSFIILLSILTKFYISSISCVRQCLVQAACEMGDLSDFQKVQIMEAHLTGVSVTLTAQLFSVLSRNYCKVIANLNIHHEDPVSTKTDQKELYKANVHERAAIAKTLIKKKMVLWLENLDSWITKMNFNIWPFQSTECDPFKILELKKTAIFNIDKGDRSQASTIDCVVPTKTHMRKLIIISLTDLESSVA